VLAAVMMVAGAGGANAQPRSTVFTGGDAAPHTLNVTLGAFVPPGFDDRDSDDVLRANRSFLCLPSDDHLFPCSDEEIADKFTAFTVGAEWLIPLGNYVEAGAGIGFSRRTVSTIYQVVEDSDGTEVDSNLRVQRIPISLTARVLPLGQDFPIQPYVGAGLSILNWRYHEFGEFVDFSVEPDPVVFEDDDTFKDSGTETGLVVLGGLRFAADAFTIGGEVRYEKFDPAELDEAIGFEGSQLELGGWSYQMTIGFRFFR
jgi:hypothetical protein